MKFFQKTQRHRGFTLIELILYLGIVTMLMSAIIPFAWNIIEGGVKSATNQEIFTQGQYVADRITYEIRNASGINYVNPGQISLVTNNPVTNPTIISLNSGVINIQQGNSTPFAINSHNTTVQSLTFTNNSSSDGKTKNIQFVFTINANYPGAGTRQEYQASVAMEGSAEVRSASNWYNSSWLYRQAIVIDHTKVSGNPTNFPVLIKLPSNADLAAHAQTTGNDILFTDSTGVTQIPHEIETYTSATGALIAWVNVPSVTSTADTTIYMYYGNPSAANQQNKPAVWTNGYKAVLHMMETSGNVSDSSNNGNTGISSSTSTSTGEIWNARTYAGATSSNLQIANNANIDFGANANFMVSLWFKSTQSPADNIYPTLLAKEINGHDQGYAILENGLPTANNFLYGEIYVAGTQYFVGSGQNYNDGNWHYVVLERSGSTLNLFVDGALVGTTPAVTSSISTTANVEMGSFPTGTGNFTGSEDEVRISNIAHSANWIATEYANQSSPSTFYSLPSSGPSGPAVQDSVGTVQEKSSVSSVSWNHTVGNFSNRLLVVGVSVNSSKTVSSVTYGSQTLTRFDSMSYGGTYDNELWYVVNPAVGTAAVTVNLSGTANVVTDSVSFSNVNQATPFGTDAKASGNGTTATVNVPSASNQVILDVLASDTTNGNFQPAAGQTALWNGFTNFPQSGASTKPSAGATTPMTWTDSLTDNWALIGVPIL